MDRSERAKKAWIRYRKYSAFRQLYSLLAKINLANRRIEAAYKLISLNEQRVEELSIKRAQVKKIWVKQRKNVLY